MIDNNGVDILIGNELIKWARSLLLGRRTIVLRKPIISLISEMKLMGQLSPKETINVISKTKWVQDIADGLLRATIGTIDNIPISEYEKLRMRDQIAREIARIIMYGG